MKKTIHSVLAGLICCFFFTFALSSTISAAEKAASKKPKVTKAQTSKKPKATKAQTSKKSKAKKAPTSKKPATKMASDANVLAAQKKLNRSGFKLEEDGKMGPQTSSALKRYQKKKGLKATGKLNQATLAKLGIK